MSRAGDRAKKPSSGESSGETGIGHRHLGARSLYMARIVVERIDAEPSLFNVAHENLERWRRHRGTLSRATREWEQILNCPWSEIRQILLDESGEGQRLRSSQPYRGIVTEEERLEIMRRHPPPWRHEPYDPDKIPQEVIERILSEDSVPNADETGSSHPGDRRWPSGKGSLGAGCRRGAQMRCLRLRQDASGPLGVGTPGDGM